MGAGEIWGSIKRGFGHVTDFSGRDTRGQFWPYAIFVLILQYVIGFAVSIPLMVGAAVNAFQEVGRAAAEGGSADPTGQAQMDMMANMMGNMETTYFITVPISVLATLLLLAALARRLHDRGFSGWWMAPAAVTQAIGAYVGWQQIQAMQAMFANPQSLPQDPVAMQARMNELAGGSTLSIVLFVANLAIYLFLLVQTVQAGQPETNAYGPPAGHDPFA